MFKKIMKFISTIVFCFSMCSCNNKENIEYDVYTKIAPNLYEVNCDEYDYDYLFEDGRGNISTNAGCSGIRVGNYLGRNFDFVAGDAAEVVVKTVGNKDRYASIAMTGGMMWLTSEFMDNGLDEDAKKLIPLLLLDGINEKGVVVEINCVNNLDTGGLAMHTNEGKKMVPQLAVVRYLLDNAATAKEAVEIMKNIDIVITRDVLGLNKYGFEIHFLIADKNDSYVVEINNTKPDGEKVIVVEDATIQTNFYLHLADIENDVYSNNAIGIERYRKLFDNKDSVNSVSSMKALMQSVRYSNSSRTDGEYDPGENYDNPYTCFSDHQVLGENGINYANYKDHIDELITKMKHNEIETRRILADPMMVNPNNLWVTSHSSVYDIVNKTMTVAIYERFETYYDYSFE